MNEAEFAALVAPIRGGLRLHCYRMLGSSHDSDDMVQETLLRAWKSRAALADRDKAKPWLYRIATNACLDELAQRPRRVLASSLRPAADPRAAAAEAIEDALWLEPMPDAWLGGVERDPAATYELRESVALAFVAALQVLTPPQRAALLLRDVVGMSADETAEVLGQSVSASNSALHRARTMLEERVVTREPTNLDFDRSVLEAYVRAVAACDIDAIVALMHEDLHTTMPPSPTWIAGRADNAVFYRAMFARWTVGNVALTPLGANGQHGFAFTRDGAVRAIEVVEVCDGLLSRVHHFMQPALIPLFIGPA